MARLSPELWRGRRVLVTGHTGFKGSWLGQILQILGAKVSGYALEPNTHPSHFKLLNWDIEHQIGDIRDDKGLSAFVQRSEPEVVFHLAAQPLVLKSYEDPRYTYETNVMGTLNVLEAIRKTPSVKAVVVVTSDKCYENREVKTAYKEDEPMGGHDPYSSSKGCAEILTASYRRSFFDKVPLASVRAGNVLGGGDWSENRLLADFARAFAAKKKVILRSPHAVRPWQHVLDPLTGYMLLAERLLTGEMRFAKGWNFGPDAQQFWTVGEIVEEAKKRWTGFDYEIVEAQRHEAQLLMLDSSMAREELGWRPLLDIHETLAWTLDWYEAFTSREELLTRRQIDLFLERE